MIAGTAAPPHRRTAAPPYVNANAVPIRWRRETGISRRSTGQPTGEDGEYLQIAVYPASGDAGLFLSPCLG
jgi:hypothetical protein